MSEEKCNKDCSVYYFITVALVIVLWLAAAVAFWYLKVRKTDGTKQKSNTSHEMIEVSEGNQDVNMIYLDVVFNNQNMKPRETKSEQTTYSQIKNASQQNDELVYTEVKHNAKRKANNMPENTDPESTYAEVKLMSKNSQPEDGSQDLYACVNKKNPATAQKNL